MDEMERPLSNRLQPLSAPLAAMDTQKKDIVVVRGYVEAMPLGPGNEKNAKVAIVTEDGTRYSVLPKGPGLELLQEVGAPVEAKGLMSSDEGLFFIQVSSFEIQDGFDDAWYDE